MSGPRRQTLLELAAACAEGSLFSPLADGRVILTASRRGLWEHLSISRGSLWRRIRTLTEAGLATDDGQLVIDVEAVNERLVPRVVALPTSRTSTRLCSRSPSRPRSPPTVPQAFITRTAAPPRSRTSRPSQALAHVAPPTDTFNVSEPPTTRSTAPYSMSNWSNPLRRRSTVLRCWDPPPRGLATPTSLRRPSLPSTRSRSRWRLNCQMIWLPTSRFLRAAKRDTVPRCAQQSATQPRHSRPRFPYRMSMRMIHLILMTRNRAQQSATPTQRPTAR